MTGSRSACDTRRAPVGTVCLVFTAPWSAWPREKPIGDNPGPSPVDDARRTQGPGRSRSAGRRRGEVGITCLWVHDPLREVHRVGGAVNEAVRHGGIADGGAP